MRDRARIVLMGMFVSDGWVRAHVRPIGLAEGCEQIWIVTDRPMLDLPRTTYVCPPTWLRRLLGAVGARSVWLFVTVLRVRPDIVGGFHLVLNGLLALLAARLVNARALYYCVGGWLEIIGGGARSEHRLFRLMGADQRCLERMLIRLVNRMDLTFTMGTQARRILQREGVTSPIQVMAGGIDPAQFSPRPADQPIAYDVIYVGRLVPIKRIDVLLEGLALVAQRRPALQAVLVGDGPLRGEIESQVRRLGLTDKVTFAGHQEDIPAWLRQARLFVLTSDSEGLPLSVMEAAMVGLPAVVTDVGDLPDLVQNGVNGRRVPPRSPSALAEAILALLDDFSKYAAYVDNARQAASVYTVQAMSRAWEPVLAHHVGRNVSQ